MIDLCLTSLAVVSVAALILVTTLILWIRLQIRPHASQQDSQAQPVLLDRADWTLIAWLVIALVSVLVFLASIFIHVVPC